ncbi:MAG: glycosyltransferase family 2 protein [Actinomycetota bacterium]|nr:glycosyltransferase family 2 protein [Actinomycetota bacterium]
MEQHNPSVSIIIPVRNSKDHLNICVESILNQTYEFIDEIILGVGPSDDGTHKIATELESIEPRIKIVDNPSGKTASALNAAASVATGRYLVRVDTHCKLEKNYVRQAIRTIQRTKAANVGGIQKAEGRSILERSIATAMTSRFGVGNSRFHYGGEEGPSDTVYLGVYDSDVFYQLGGFNETLIRNQDYELNIRMRKNGNTVWFDPNLVVRYTPRSSIQDLFRQYFQYGQWKREVVKLHPTSIKARQIAAPLLVIGILFGIVSSIFLNIWGLAIPSVYLAGVFLASLISTSSDGWGRLCLIFVFPTMHIAWGLGFLLGPIRQRRRQGV